jgi:hypothetical protein
MTESNDFVSAAERATFVSLLQQSATNYQLGQKISASGDWRIDAEGLTQRLLSFCMRTKESNAKFFFDLYPKPDVLVYLRCSPMTALSRRRIRAVESGDPADYDDEMLNRILERVLEMARNDKIEIVELDANRSPERNTETLYRRLCTISRFF